MFILSMYPQTKRGNAIKNKLTHKQANKQNKTNKQTNKQTIKRGSCDMQQWYTIL